MEDSKPNLEQPVISVSTNNTSTPTSPIKNKDIKSIFKKYLWAIITVTLIFVLAVSTGAYYLFQTYINIKNNNKDAEYPNTESKTEAKLNKKPEENFSKEPTITTTITSISTITPTPQQPSYVAERMQRIYEDLRIYKDEGDKIEYYTAGKVSSGTYQGYTRILGIHSGPISINTDLFVTKDFKSYIADNSSNIYSTGELYNTTSFVTKSDEVYSNHPKVINLNEKFALMRIELFGGMRSFSDNQEIKGLSTSIKIYDHTSYQPALSPTDIMKEAEKYLASHSSFAGVDNTGLTYLYSLVKRSSADNLDVNRKKYLDKAAKGESPYWIDFIQPTIKLNKSEITSTAPLYSSYFKAFPDICSFGPDNVVLKNIADTEFTKIGNTGNIDLYTLKNKTHPLYKLQYERKIQSFDNNLEAFTGVNKGQTAIPSFDTYTAKNPLLFFKDYWGRWIALGEFEIMTMGGCGKPVLYLYPQTQTEVKVSFTGPIMLDTHIPAYQDGWRVLANPDGTFKNLNQKTSECQKYAKPKFGTEYAYKACLENNYPYIYWSGSSMNAEYPRVKKGWYIDRNQLEDFLRLKLAEIGLNNREINDMLEYWLPKLLAENKNYYRISFLQTAEMNQIAPMSILPRPDTVFRIFLDWDGIDKQPTTPIEPQKLDKLERKGFTVVEWGGKLR